MSTQAPPLFMEDPEWFYYDDKEGVYKLTEEAPKEARESYKEFYDFIEDQS